MKSFGIFVLVLGFFVAAESYSSLNEKINNLLNQLEDSDETQLYNRDLNERSYGIDEISDDDIDLLLSDLDKRELDVDMSYSEDEESTLMQELRRELDLLDINGEVGLNDRTMDQVVDVEQRRKGRIAQLILNRLKRFFRRSDVRNVLKRLGKNVLCFVCKRARRPLVQVVCRSLRACR